MAKWAGTRDYSEWLEYARKESTEQLLKSVSCDIYCIATIWEKHSINEHFNWISVWNQWIELKTTLDALTERGVTKFPMKIAAEGMLARLESALERCRAKNRGARLLRRKLKASIHAPGYRRIIDRAMFGGHCITSIELANEAHIAHHRIYGWILEHRKHFKNFTKLNNFIILDKRDAGLAIAMVLSCQKTEEAWKLSEEADDILIAAHNSQKGLLN